MPECGGTCCLVAWGWVAIAGRLVVGTVVGGVSIIVGIYSGVDGPVFVVPRLVVGDFVGCCGLSGLSLGAVTGVGCFGRIPAQSFAVVGVGCCRVLSWC